MSKKLTYFCKGAFNEYNISLSILTNKYFIKKTSKKLGFILIVRYQ